MRLNWIIHTKRAKTKCNLNANYYKIEGMCPPFKFLTLLSPEWSSSHSPSRTWASLTFSKWTAFLHRLILMLFKDGLVLLAYYRTILYIIITVIIISHQQVTYIPPNRTRHLSDRSLDPFSSIARGFCRNPCQALGPAPTQFVYERVIKSLWTC